MTKEQAKIIIEDPKEFLLRAQKADKMIKARCERIAYWRSLAVSVSVPPKDNIGGCSGKGPAKLIETCVVNIIAAQEELAEEIQSLLDIQKETKSVITELVKDGKLQKVLELRYLNCCDFTQIAEILGYTYRWVQTLHIEAIAEIQKNVKNFL